jgi:hypothetical protein
MHLPPSLLRPALGALLVPFLSAQPAPVRATIKPSVVRLAPGAQQRFKVILIATRLRAASAPASVQWTVNDVPGGNAEFGTIDSSGLYRAPAKAPVPHEIRVRADAEGAANRFLWATVLMGNPDPAYKLIGGWAEKTSGAGRLRKPHGISFDAGGNLLITDQGAGRVFRYSPQGKFLAEIGRGPGSEAGQFTEPRFALVDASGNIFVTDLKGDRPRLQVFDPQGRYQRIFAEKGTGPGQILRGHGLAFDRQGRLYATDVDNMRVSIFEPSGKFVSSWGKDGMNPGDFNAPHGLYMDPNDDVFVNGYYGPTQKFTPGGDFLFAFAHGDPPDGPVYFHSIAGDRWGNVYVTVRTLAGYQGALESQAGKKLSLMKYNNNGDFISSLSLSVKEHIESWVAVDAQGHIHALYTSRDQAGVEIYAPQ